AEWVLDATRHLSGEASITLAHFLRRIPIGPFRLAADLFRSRPGEALAPHRNLVDEGRTWRLHEKQPTAPGIDDNAANRIAIGKMEAGGCLRGDVGTGAARLFGRPTRAWPVRSLIVIIPPVEEIVLRLRPVIGIAAIGGPAPTLRLRLWRQHNQSHTQ